MLTLFALLACNGGAPGKTATPEPETGAETETDTGTADVPPETCDAGDAAWVSRAIPALWGRLPHGAAEVEMWTAAVETLGRADVIDAMTRDPAFRDHWQDFFADVLNAARVGDRSASACFSGPRLDEHDGSLATFLANNEPLSTYGDTFNMADVIRSAMVADDLSVIWRANLFARMSEPLNGANVGPYELEENRRISFGEDFFQGYLHRNLTCLPCHNSKFSVTGGNGEDEPDRTWEIPGAFEEAILGDSAGIGSEEAYQLFRHKDLSGSIAPWGMGSCGLFAEPGDLGDDYLGVEGFFIDDHGETGSVWTLEAYLHEGIDSLRGRGLSVGKNNRVDGAEAFAYLVAQVIADRVWEQVHGARLTIAHDFPRNEAQRDRLQAMTDGLVESGFSMRGLLIEVMTDAYYNAGLPEDCETADYGMAPIYAPFSDAEEVAEKRGNGPGDQVHRHPGRTLLRATHEAMGWAQPARFPAYGDPTLDLQAAMGIYLRESQPGHSGTDFQGLLAYEATYGACAEPEAGDEVGDGCDITETVPGCGNCNCEECVCSLDPYCCEVQWDRVCVEHCTEDCEGCGRAEQLDTVERLLAAASESNATVEALVLALKDRLVQRGSLEDDERALIEALMNTPLETPAGDVVELEPELRALCGALLVSPDFFLAQAPAAIPPRPALELDVEADCLRLEALTAEIGAPLTCAVEVQQ